MRILVILLTLTMVVACRGPRGDQGIQGLPGIGETGPAGRDGNDGATGPQGPAGADGQIATVVPLCPGVSSYPGVFVEAALCINNQLYGVYSANGGFLTELPPGNYTSNAIGSACNLTVQPNCVVTH